MFKSPAAVPPPAYSNADDTREEDGPPSAPSLDYEVPSDSSLPSENYWFEVMKNGIIVEQTKPRIDKEYLIVGRLPTCDIELAHASVSRQHAIIQFKSDDTVHLYDLNSSHQTILNKLTIQPRTYHRLKVGDMIRFGQSSRIYILQGPPEPEPEPEPQLHMISTRSIVLPRAMDSEDQGASWGFGEDASEPNEMRLALADFNDDGDMDENAYYVKDPKKAFRTWCEQNGHDMEFEIIEDGPGHARVYTAKMTVQVDGGMEEIECQGIGDRKREAEKLACLDACRKLDRMGALRETGGEGGGGAEKRRKKRAVQDDDDDDDDDYYDRTKSANSEKRKEEHSKRGPQTYESLKRRKEEILSTMKELQRKIEVLSNEIEKTTPDKDDIDGYINFLQKKGKEVEVKALKGHKEDLFKEMENVQKLIMITKPALEAIPKKESTEKKEAVTAKIVVGPSTAVKHEQRKEDDSFFKSPLELQGKRPSKPSSPISTSHVTVNSDEKKDADPETSKRKLEDDHLPTMEPSAKRTRRRNIIMTEEQVKSQERVETEDVVDFLPPGEKEMKGKQLKSLNSAYGY